MPRVASVESSLAAEALPSVRASASGGGRTGPGRRARSATTSDLSTRRAKHVGDVRERRSRPRRTPPRPPRACSRRRTRTAELEHLLFVGRTAGRSSTRPRHGGSAGAAGPCGRPRSGAGTGRRAGRRAAARGSPSSGPPPARSRAEDRRAGCRPRRCAGSGLEQVDSRPAAAARSANSSTRVRDGERRDRPDAPRRRYRGPRGSSPRPAAAGRHAGGARPPARPR